MASSSSACRRTQTSEHGDGQLAVIGRHRIEGLSHRDLSQESELVALPGGDVRVASPFDLLLIARARGELVQAGALEALLEHRRRWPGERATRPAAPAPSR